MQVGVDELLPMSAFHRKNGRLVDRIYAGIVLSFRLLSRVAFLFKPCDILLVHREAFPFFTPFFERIATRRAKVSILDIDDAIYTDPTHRRDWRSVMRNPTRALEFRDLFDLVLCGNDVLMNDFGSGKADVLFTPTCPPTSTFDTIRRPTNPRTIMWTGSQSTLGSLISVLPQVMLACETEDLILHVLGGANIVELPRHPRILAERWSIDAEMELLGRASLGLMPLPDTAWERGKSGYKAILYLCAGLPSVISPVGINKRLAAEFALISSCSGNDWALAIVEALKESGRHVGADSVVAESTRLLARDMFDSAANASRTVDHILSRCASGNHVPSI